MDATQESTTTQEQLERRMFLLGIGLCQDMGFQPSIRLPLQSKWRATERALEGCGYIFHTTESSYGIPVKKTRRYGLTPKGVAAYEALLQEDGQGLVEMFHSMNGTPGATRNGGLLASLTEEDNGNGERLADRASSDCI